MPVIAFIPSSVVCRGVFAVDAVPDFYRLAVRCNHAGFHTELRANWLPGLTAALAAADRRG